MARISWHSWFMTFIVYIKNLDKITVPMLKKWSDIGRTVYIGLLFRSRSNFGLDLTSLSLSKMQLVKRQLLQSSSDESIRNLFKTKQQRECKKTRIWKASQVHSIVDAHLIHTLVLSSSLIGRKATVCWVGTLTYSWIFIFYFFLFHYQITLWTSIMRNFQVLR